MLRTLRRAALGGAVGATALALTGLVLQAAVACDAFGQNCGPETPPPAVDGQTVTVVVRGTLVSGGSAGTGGSRSTTVQVTPPCRYVPGMTGKDYYEFWERGGIGNADREQITPYEGYEEHKDDDEGRWWGGMCSSADFDGDLDAFFDYAHEWFDDHGGLFIQPGGTPPVPPIPPEILLEAARDVMTLPEPTFDWNPKATDAQATLVNLDTWFWLEDPTDVGSIEASAGESSVRVDAVREAVSFSAPTAGTVTCPDGGRAWAPAATSECVLAFLRSSGPGATEVTAEATWSLTWSANGEPQGALDAPEPAVATASVRVLEAQALVRSSG